MGPRVGYNVGINEQLSFWPKGGLVFSHSSSSPDDSSDSRTGLEIYAPLLFHPAPHFFLGGGPGLSTDLSSSGGAKTTTIRLESVVGGWF